MDCFGIFIKPKLENLWISLRACELQAWQVLVLCGCDTVKSSPVRTYLTALDIEYSQLDLQLPTRTIIVPLCRVVYKEFF